MITVYWCVCMCVPVNQNLLNLKILYNFDFMMMYIMVYYNLYDILIDYKISHDSLLISLEKLSHCPGLLLWGIKWSHDQ